MLKARMFFILASAAMLGAGCSRYTQAAAAGDVITPEDAAKTVVLHVDNMNLAPMELRTIENGQSLYIGSVGAQQSTDLLLDPMLFPTTNLYLAAIPSGGRGQARVGPLAASKGDKINFTVQQSLELSRALVVR